MAKLPNLRKRIVVGLLIYTMALTFAVGLHGFLVNEHIEALVWENILNIDLDKPQSPEKEIVENSFTIYDSRQNIIPSELDQYKTGIHDEISYHDKDYVIRVIEHDHYKQILMLDITEIEKQEFYLVIFTLLLTAIAIILMMWIAYWQLGKLINPLTALANDLSNLPPDEGKITINQEQLKFQESFLLTDSIQTYIEKSQSYIEKEKVFFSIVSHELRTPITIIAGAVEIGRRHIDKPQVLKLHLDRITRVIQEMEDLVACLLLLARNEQGLEKYLQDIDINHEISAIVESHLPLCEGKQLKIENLVHEPFTLNAPLQLIKVTIGNLLRNAIENSDKGVITIIYKQDQIIIEDPGHGMTASELSQLYTHQAKAGVGRAGGIGIPLILKICDHFGWQLRFESKKDRGTIAILTFKAIN